MPPLLDALSRLDRTISARGGPALLSAPRPEQPGRRISFSDDGADGLQGRAGRQSPRGDGRPPKSALRTAHSPDATARRNATQCPYVQESPRKQGTDAANGASPHAAEEMTLGCSCGYTC